MAAPFFYARLPGRLDEIFGAVFCAAKLGSVAAVMIYSASILLASFDKFTDSKQSRRKTNVLVLALKSVCGSKSVSLYR